MGASAFFARAHSKKAREHQEKKVRGSAKKKKERGGAKKNKLEKIESVERERKKARIRAFSFLCRTSLETRFPRPKPLDRGKSKGLEYCTVSTYVKYKHHFSFLLS